MIAHTKEPSLNECIIYPTRIPEGHKKVASTKLPYIILICTPVFNSVSSSKSFLPFLTILETSLSGYTASDGPFRFFLDTETCFNLLQRCSHHGNYVKHLTLKATVAQPVDYFHTTSQLTSLRCYNVVLTLRFGHENVVNNVVSMCSRTVFLTCTQRCQTTFHITFSQPSCNIF